MTAPLPDWKTLPKNELRDQLAGYCRDGLTAQQIADKFQNCSRSAVIGMVSRLKLQLNAGNTRRGMTGRRKADVEAPSANPRPPAARRVTKLVEQTSSWRGANNPLATDFKSRASQRAASPGLPPHLVAGEPRAPSTDVVPVSRGLGLRELTEHTCRWPVGDPQAADFGFCGNEARLDGPYCRYHARLAYTPPTTRQRAGLRSAERIS